MPTSKALPSLQSRYDSLLSRSTPWRARSCFVEFSFDFRGARGQEKKPETYYFLVANAKFMLDEEEHFQEQLAEKLRNYGERDKEQDFWLVVEPKFLDRFPNITKRLKRPAVALVSTDGNWIT